jgi:Family of unknown function (DUF6314)
MSEPALETLLEGLTGRWTITRAFEGEGALAVGVASLHPDGAETLAYRETTQLTLSDGRVLQAYRNYRYRFVDEWIEIHFDDGPDKGRLFVRLAFAQRLSKQAEAFDIHHCGDDTYRVLFRLNLPSLFETEIAVSGPRKKYRAVSRYERIEEVLPPLRGKVSCEA